MRRKRQHGFTMAEALVVIGIIVVLAAAAIPNGMGALNNIKQIQLNRSAETIYMTAQRNLAAFKANNPGATPAAFTTVTPQSGDSEKSKVLPADTLSPALYAGYWAVQYEGWTMKTVYYSETEDITGLNETALNAWKTSVAGGRTGKVGWYGE